MFGLFKKKSPAASERPLYFKGPVEAFQFSCELLDNSLSAGATLPALVLHAVDDATPAVALKKDGTQMVRLRIASSDGGFAVVAAVTAGRGPTLKPGDLVAWQAGAVIPELAAIVSDKRAAWAGLIVALLKPEFSPQRGWVLDGTYRP